MYKCIIVDDEPHALKSLAGYIDSLPNLNLVSTFSDPLAALLEISSGEPVDLLLLDIDMPRVSGLELARQLRHKTEKLVFTTSHSKYGYEAFEVQADAYLLKPYSLSKFASTIVKLFPALPAAESVPPPDNFFFVKDKNDHLKLVKIKYAEIIAIESQQNYVLMHTLHKKVLTYMSLTEISRNFRVFPNFVQFQRSFILNKDFIESIEGNTIKMTGGVQITVGDYYRKDYQAFLSRSLLKKSAAK